MVKKKKFKIKLKPKQSKRINCGWNYGGNKFVIVYLIDQNKFYRLKDYPEGVHSHVSVLHNGTIYSHGGNYF